MNKKEAFITIVGGALLACALIFLMYKEDQLAQYKAGVEQEQLQEQVEESNPLGIGEDVLITIAGVITNATPDEVMAAHTQVVKTVSEKLGTNGLKVIYVEFR